MWNKASTIGRTFNELKGESASSERSTIPKKENQTYTKAYLKKPKDAYRIVRKLAQITSTFFYMTKDSAPVPTRLMNSMEKPKKWKWEYGKKTHGGSKDVNIVYDREEEDPEPTMMGCVRIGKKPKNIVSDILPSECATMHDKFAVTPKYTSTQGKGANRPSCYPHIMIATKRTTCRAGLMGLLPMRLCMP